MEAVSSSTDVIDNDAYCNTCKNVFPSKLERFDHFWEDTPCSGVITCDLCDGKFDVCDFRQHICPFDDFVRSTSDVKIYKFCELCCEDIESLDEWMDHSCNPEYINTGVTSSSDVISSSDN